MADGDVRQLVDAARALLDANWTSGSTVPSRTLYPHQWSWDSAFIAIGRSVYDQGRAERELESLFAAQWSNGMVPHIVFSPGVSDADYFPGPGFWDAHRTGRVPRGVRTSGITQPPIHARAALELYRNARAPKHRSASCAGCTQGCGRSMTTLHATAIRLGPACR